MTVILLLVAVLILLLLNLVLVYRNSPADIKNQILRLDTVVGRFDGTLRDEMGRNREETSRSARENREELTAAFRHLSENLLISLRELSSANDRQLNAFGEMLQKSSLLLAERFDKLTATHENHAQLLKDSIMQALTNSRQELQNALSQNADRIQNFSNTLAEKFQQLQQSLITQTKEARQEQSETLSGFQKNLSDQFTMLSKTQNESMEKTTQHHQSLKQDVEKRLESIRGTLEVQLEKLQVDNRHKLEEIRQTVDEKLQSTLEKRLAESFNQVSERLQQVHEGLGEMRNLASGVGDLKKVLSNVKTRGTMGEIQLSAILSHILAPQQYEANCRIRPHSREVVEFAVKLPGDGAPVYLPIDSKFPAERYQQVLDAYETGEKTAIQTALKALADEIMRCGREIREKYIESPFTTDFGVLFLPFEGLYAEVVRQPNLLETLQREHKIIITGPTTLAALLNSLQMGFKTLAIQKRSSEVWKILATVKTEFDKFGEVLSKARKKLEEAGKEIDDLVVTRTRAIQRNLRTVETSEEELPKLGV